MKTKQITIKLYIIKTCVFVTFVNSIIRQVFRHLVLFLYI